MELDLSKIKNLKFAIISDIHFFGNENHRMFNGVIRKMTQHSLPLLNEFIKKMNEKVEPAFVVNLGDAIENIDKKNDIKNLTQVLNILNKLTCPVYNLIGNHEQRKIELKELEKIIKHKPVYYSFDKDYYHFVVLYSDDYDKKGPIIDNVQKEWLKNDLKDTNKLTIVFVHHGLAEQNLIGNFWFEGKPERSLIHNKEEIRKIFEDSKKVKAVFNGHLHWNKMDVHNEIPYFNIQSLVENFKEKDLPSKTWAIVELSRDCIKVDIQGEDKENYIYQFKK
ncbi:MAG: metallophosphoesterase [Candidatus Paceibacterota bacterium]|jgi:3',5'-cyclic AMP phosphodiesterase CpdA